MRLRRQDVICAIEGAFLNVVSSSLGEVIAAVPVPAGTYSVGQRILLAGRGQHLECGDGVAVVSTGVRSVMAEHPERFETAAVPRYRVTNAMRTARQLELSLRRLEALDRVTAARMAALKRAGGSVIPDAPKEPTKGPTQEATPEPLAEVPEAPAGE